jgi:hypothetical protein
MTQMTEEQVEELCKECGRVAHEPGMSEFSNCGEGEICHPRDPHDRYSE